MSCSVSRVSWGLCLVLQMLLWSSQACFIRNCPRGGKRAVEASKQCMSCGPRGVGQCVGPSICCGHDIGCLMGTPEADACQHENESSVPCTVSGSQCGENNMGRCVANGICCVDDACSFNTICEDTSERRESDRSTREELLTLIRRLLVNHN